MPLLDFKCSKCGKVFDELVKNADNTKDVICPVCGSSEHERVYQGKCYGSKSSGCTHNCATCSGCK